MLLVRFQSSLIIYILKTKSKSKSKFNYNSKFYNLISDKSKVFFYKLIDSNGFYLGLYTFKQAYSFAKSTSRDLIEISKSGLFSVCRLIKYGKQEYSYLKKIKNKGKPIKSKIHLKEMKFRIFICKRDYYNKIKKVTKFFDQGHKVKILLYFKGREIYKKKSTDLFIKELIADLSYSGILENKPNINDKQIYLYFRSKRIRYEF